MIKPLKFLAFILCFELMAGPLFARSDNTPGPLSLSVVKVKAKGGWTEVTMAIQNTTDKDISFECCQTYLETDTGYAVSSLTRGEVESQIYNRARTGALIGGIVGLGLGIGGLASGNNAVGYSGLGVGAGSAIAGVAGESAANSAARGIIIDDIMRNQVFPAGLKVAGIAYFPPKKKWPDSKKAQAVHLTYSLNGRSYQTSAPVP